MAAYKGAEVYRRPLDIQVSQPLLQALHRRRDHMRALVVGGSVRDAILGCVSKDIDIEVYGATYDQLVELLQEYGRTDLVGKAFGVIKFRDDRGGEADVSIPRRESKTGVGHKDFATSFDPNITAKEAASRRDFTMNALAWDPFTQELHDYFRGVDDVRNGVLRATSPAFAEDALRVLRGMQFSARFDMRIELQTAQLCRSLIDEYRHLPRERVAEEWMKLAIKGRRPSLLWTYLMETGWIELYKPLARLVDVPQDPEWHPEGSVDVHVAHVMDAMAGIADREQILGETRAILIFAALTHDLAKSFVHEGGTTMLRDKGGRMRWTAYGHEEASGLMARDFLTSIGINARIVDRVVPLVENHLQHVKLANNGPIGLAQVRHLADRLAPATIYELSLLIEADQSGRSPLAGGLPESARQIVDLATQDGIANCPPPKLMQGREVLPFYQRRSGPHIGEAVATAYQAYLNGEFSSLEDGRNWLKGYLEKRVRLINGDDVLPYFGKSGPKIGAVVKAAWEAQVAGEFSDRVGAQAWLERHLARR